MERSEIIKKLSVYFVKQELVGRETYYYYKSRKKDPWTCLDTDLLHCLLITRQGLALPFTANTWHKGGEYDERGHRANIQEVAYNKTINKELYLSAHPMGKGVDFKAKRMESDDVRAWIRANEHLYPCKIRLENRVLRTGKTITWVHLDTIWEKKNPKVYLFDV